MFLVILGYYEVLNTVIKSELSSLCHCFLCYFATNLKINP